MGELSQPNELMLELSLTNELLIILHGGTLPSIVSIILYTLASITLGVYTLKTQLNIHKICLTCDQTILEIQAVQQPIQQLHHVPDLDHDGICLTAQPVRLY